MLAAEGLICIQSLREANKYLLLLFDEMTVVSDVIVGSKCKE